MSYCKSIKTFFLGFCICVVFTSCFKDVDFSKAQDISLEPDLEVDLLYYQLNENDYIDSNSGIYNPVIRDTVRLEFLDDDYIQDGLVYTALRFRHENQFPNQIVSKIRFLRENGREEFKVVYTVPAGANASAAVIDTTRILQGRDIEKIRRSIQMVVEHEVVGGDENLNGELMFKSKGLFRFEF
ncbi:MAG: hypothetical protein KJP01_04140 [Gramella sp.]|nr:hypothetical protein [Christiangramia sp.]